MTLTECVVITIMEEGPINMDALKESVSSKLPGKSTNNLSQVISYINTNHKDKIKIFKNSEGEYHIKPKKKDKNTRENASHAQDKSSIASIVEQLELDLSNERIKRQSLLGEISDIKDMIDEIMVREGAM